MPPRGPYKNGNRYWANVPGKGRIPLIPPGEKLATTEPDIAARLYGEEIRRIEARKRGIALGLDDVKDIPPGKLVTMYMQREDQRRREARGLRADDPLPRRDREALTKTHKSIMICVYDYPELKKLTSVRQIDDAAIEGLLKWLKTGGRMVRGRKLRPGAVRRIAMELSGMLTYAEKKGFLKRNPIPGHDELPKGRRKTALDPSKYLTRFEVRDTLAHVRYSSKNPWAVEQAHTLFYTGARLSEATELLVTDFDFDNQLIYIREHATGAGGEARDVKNVGSVREIPFWPRLQQVMRASFDQVPRHPAGLAFPAPGTELLPLEQQRAMKRLRYSLKSAAKRGDVKKEIGHHTARHSYASVRQEMVEVDVLGRERPVPTAYIARELGHIGEKELRETYGHLPKTGVRQSILDYQEPDPVPYMLEYRAKRQKLATRNAKREQRREQRLQRLRQP